MIDRCAKHVASIFLLCAVAIFGVACHRAQKPSTKRYPFTGRVVSIDTKSQTALIDGDLVQGFMEAMAMSYTVKPASVLGQLASGDSISAQVVVVDPDSGHDADSEYWLEDVKITAHAPSVPASGTGSLHTPQPRGVVPGFPFTNQDGRRISLSQYRGKVLLVTFIYTRCPFPDFCP